MHFFSVKNFKSQIPKSLYILLCDTYDIYTYKDEKQTGCCTRANIIKMPVFWSRHFYLTINLLTLYIDLIDWNSHEWYYKNRKEVQIMKYKICMANDDIDDFIFGDEPQKTSER